MLLGLVGFEGVGGGGSWGWRVVGDWVIWGKKGKWNPGEI